MRRSTPLPGLRSAQRSLRCAAARGLVVACLAATAAVQAQSADDAATLLRLLNQYRAAPRCAGAALPPQPPLRAVAELAAAGPGAATRSREGLAAALRAAGYAAGRSLVIDLQGPRDAAAAMNLIAALHCAALASASYRDVGITRRADRWRLVLAEPLLSPALGSSDAAGRRVLELANAARAQARRCGTRRLPAAPPLAWNPTLAAAALAHSRDMAARDTLSHAGSDGSRAGQRARRLGYPARAVGENVAAGQGSPEQVVADWVASPGHCVNLMARDFREMGAAYAIEMRSSAVIYWTQVFGVPRTGKPSPPLRSAA